MTVGPLIMAVGSDLDRAHPGRLILPWQFDISNPATWVPSAGYFTDVLPYYLIFGVGVSIMVAPLTTALMRSVPAARPASHRRSTTPSRALARSSPERSSSSSSRPVLRRAGARSCPAWTSSAQVRQDIPPLNQPAPGVPADQVAAAKLASTDSFHLAMFTASGLLFAGALTNACSSATARHFRVNRPKHHRCPSPRSRSQRRARTARAQLQVTISLTGTVGAELAAELGTVARSG